MLVETPPAQFQVPAETGMPGMHLSRLAFFTNQPIMKLPTIDRRHPKNLPRSDPGLFVSWQLAVGKRGAVSGLRREQLEASDVPHIPATPVLAGNDDAPVAKAERAAVHAVGENGLLALELRCDLAEREHRTVAIASGDEQHLAHRVARTGGRNRTLMDEHRPEKRPLEGRARGAVIGAEGDVQRDRGEGAKHRRGKRAKC